MFIEKIKDALAQNDTIKARSLIVSQLDGDRRSDPMQTLLHRQDFPKSLFEKEDDSFTFSPQEQWGFDYWNALRVCLRDNFSEKKLDHLYEVMLYLREQRDSRFTFSNARKSKKTAQTSINKCVVVGASTGVGAAVGMFVNGGSLGKVFGGAALGGGLGLLLGLGYLYYKNSSKSKD